MPERQAAPGQMRIGKQHGRSVGRTPGADGPHVRRAQARRGHVGLAARGGRARQVFFGLAQTLLRLKPLAQRYHILARSPAKPFGPQLGMFVQIQVDSCRVGVDQRLGLGRGLLVKRSADLGQMKRAGVEILVDAAGRRSKRQRSFAAGAGEVFENPRQVVLGLGARQAESGACQRFGINVGNAIRVAQQFHRLVSSLSPFAAKT